MNITLGKMYINLSEERKKIFTEFPKLQDATQFPNSIKILTDSPSINIEFLLFDRKYILTSEILPQVGSMIFQTYLKDELEDDLDELEDMRIIYTTDNYGFQNLFEFITSTEGEKTNSIRHFNQSYLNRLLGCVEKGIPTWVNEFLEKNPDN